MRVELTHAIFPDCFARAGLHLFEGNVLHVRLIVKIIITCSIWSVYHTRLLIGFAPTSCKSPDVGGTFCVNTEFYRVGQATIGWLAMWIFFCQENGLVRKNLFKIGAAIYWRAPATLKKITICNIKHNVTSLCLWLLSSSVGSIHFCKAPTSDRFPPSNWAQNFKWNPFPLCRKLRNHPRGSRKQSSRPFLPEYLQHGVGGDQHKQVHKFKALWSAFVFPFLATKSDNSVQVLRNFSTLSLWVLYVDRHKGR